MMTADRRAAFGLGAAALLVAALALWIIGDVLLRGFDGLAPAFLLADPLDGGRAGGIRPVLVSTLLVTMVCLLTAAPVGLLAGLLLAERSHGARRGAHLIRLSLDTLAGVPSIIFGLVGNAVFVGLFGWRLSILSGGLTLAVMVLPFLIRSVEASLRSLPPDFGRAATALGLGPLSRLGRILLPAALPGLLTGLVLGLGRALAETAALLFTSGYGLRLPASLLDSGRTLSIHILDLAMNVPGGTANAYRSAAVLILLILLINSAVLALGGMNRWRP
ncbi:MAG: phosphate ABC transporter permease PstA [Rhodothalassiaceae bacterium]